MNTNTGVADLRQDVLSIDQNVSKIGQDMSKIGQDTGSRNRVVRDMRNFYRILTHANRCLDSEQVRTLDYREIRA